jgi:phenylacetate-CoA ligase
MGTPLGFYCLIESGWREKAFMDAQWARVGFKPEHTRAVLKGAVITNDRHWKYDARERAYLLSSFHLTPENAAEYARLIRSRSIRYLHTYPSAALDFARNLQTAGVEIPQFRVVFAGSENMYSGQREAIEKLYGCRVYTWYGHSENVVMAGECEVSTSYHVFPEYGAVEVIKEDGTCATQEGEVGELVGTSLFNTAMPLVRYRTGDWAVLGPKRCSCGRSYRLLSETRGRWFQEMFVGKEGNFISITAVNMHSDLFDHVQQYQFHQKEPGRAVLRIVRGPEYSERDSQNILKQLLAKVGDSMELRLEFWDEIPRTAQGKFRFIVQELPTPISLERDEV